FFTATPASAMILLTMPSRCAVISISFSTMIGPEARNSGCAIELLDVLVPAFSAGVADSDAATVVGGDAGEFVHAMPDISHIAITVNGADFVIRPSTSNYHPNQLQSFDQIHIAGRRNITTPAARHPVIIFPRPCIPARNAASGLGTPTRAKNTGSVSLKTPSGLTTATCP